VREGAYISGHRQKELDMAATLIGEGVATVRGDVQNLDDLDRLYERIKAEKGMIDILVANVGFIDPQALVDATEENFDKTFRINVRGLLFGPEGTASHPRWWRHRSDFVRRRVQENSAIHRIRRYQGQRSFVRAWTAELKESPAVRSDDPATLIRTVLFGSQATAMPQAPTAPAMLSFAWRHRRRRWSHIFATPGAMRPLPCRPIRCERSEANEARVARGRKK
jgi:hypothetical protein